MKIVLYRADRAQGLLEELCRKIFQPSESEHIFSSHGILVANSYGKSHLQDYLLSHSPFDFLGNVHFLDWSDNLQHLLENSGSIFSKEGLALSLGVFLKENEVEHKISIPEGADVFSLGSYYYELFLEYEIFLPEILSNRFEHPMSSGDSFLFSEKAKFHKTLYQFFWQWMERKFSSLAENIPDAFLYSQTKCLKNSLQGMKEVHLFLPDRIFPSQLALLRDILGQRPLYIYVLEKPLLYDLPEGLYQKKHLIEYWKQSCQNLEIPYEEMILSSSDPLPLPHIEIARLENESQEYQDIFARIVDTLEKESSLTLSQYSVAFPPGDEHALAWERVFGPYQDRLPAHFLSLQKRPKTYDIYEALGDFLHWSHTGRSLEGLLKIVRLPVIRASLDVTDSDILELSAFLQEQGAYGEDSLYLKENQLSYHLYRYRYRHFLDLSREYDFREIPEPLLLFCLMLLEKSQDLWVQEKDRILKLEDLGDLENFFEVFLPASFWKELEDPHLRKDMLAFYDTLELLYTFFPCWGKMDCQALQVLFLEKRHAEGMKENLAFVKRKGITLGNIEDLLPFPIAYLRFPQFSEKFTPLGSSFFHQENCLREIHSSLEEHLKNGWWCHFFELFSEAIHVEFSYYDKDPQTQQVLSPHVLLSIFDKLGWVKHTRENELIKIALDPSAPYQYSETPLPSSKISQQSKYLSISDFFSFLNFPLKDRLNRLWGRGKFWDSLYASSSVPYLFSTTSRSQKKLWERVFLRSFHDPEIFEQYFKKLENSGKGGISRHAQIWGEKIFDQKKEVWEFLSQVEECHEEWGEYDHHISIGPYTTAKDEIEHRILSSPVVGNVRIVGELFHTYLKMEPDRVILTLPNFYQSEKALPSLKMLLSAMACGLSLQKEQLMIRILYPKDEKLGQKTYQYAISDVSQYFTQCLSQRDLFSTQPFSLWDIKDAYAKSQDQFWKEDRVQALMQNLQEDTFFNLFAPSSEEDLGEIWKELKILYQFPLQSPVLGEFV